MKVVICMYVLWLPLLKLVILTLIGKYSSWEAFYELFQFLFLLACYHTQINPSSFSSLFIWNPTQLLPHVSGEVGQTLGYLSLFWGFIKQSAKLNLGLGSLTTRSSWALGFLWECLLSAVSNHSFWLNGWFFRRGLVHTNIDIRK